jgi:hypothetical protein
MIRAEWKKNDEWYGPGASLYYEIDIKNKLIICIMCRFSSDDKVEGFRSEIKVVSNGEPSVGHVYDEDLDVVKLKSLIKAKELGFDLKGFVK